MSATSEEICLLCVQQEVAKMLSLCLEIGLELKTREDVQNLILICDYSSLYNDQAFVENVIDAFLNLV